MTEAIVAEKSQHSPNVKPWWWLRGNTYPHRQLLKQQGARYSGKRHAWYFIGWELPAAIRELLTPQQGTAAAVPENHPLVSTISPTEATSVAIPASDETPPDHAQAVAATVSDRPTDSAGAELAPSAKPSGVRVIKPSSMPLDGSAFDAVQSAIRDAKSLIAIPPSES